jgi:hypothetical protein
MDKKHPRTVAGKHVWMKLFAPAGKFPLRSPDYPSKITFQR